MHHREYIRATGINILFTFALFLYSPIIAPYVKSIGLDDFQTSLIFSLLPLAIIFSSPIIGRLADNIGKTRVIIMGLVIHISALALYLIGGNWIIISIARFLEAIAVAAIALITLAKIEDSLTNKERGKYAGWSFSLTHIGAVVAPVIGGLLADYLFVKSPFLLSSFILLILAFLLAFKTSKTTNKIKKEHFNLLDELKCFWSIRQLKGMGILGFVMHATQPATTIFLPLYIIEKLGLSFTYVGVAIFFLGVGHLFQFYFGTLTNKYGRANMVVFGCFIFALFLFLLSTTHVYWVLLLILSIQGIGGAIWNVSAWTLMSDVGEKINKEGEIVGSYMSIAKIGGFISFLISGLIVQVFSIRILFMFDAFLVAIGIFIASFYFDKKHIVSCENVKPL